MIFDESLIFNLKNSALNNFFEVKKGNIGDLLDFEFFKVGISTMCLFSL